jgi:hypothetical protein
MEGIREIYQKHLTTMPEQFEIINNKINSLKEQFEAKLTVETNKL